MKTGDEQEYVRETVGIFTDKVHLVAAVDELQREGFRQNELGLLASEQTVRQKLGSYYSKVNEDGDTTHSREVAFVTSEAGRDTMDVLGEGLYFVGGTTAVGALVASAAILGGPLAVAITSVLAVGAVGTLAGAMANKSDIHYLHDQIEEGHILLLIRHTDTSREARAKEILKHNQALDTRVYDVPLTE